MQNIVFPAAKVQTAFWLTVVAGTAVDLASKAAVFQWLQRRWPPQIVIIEGFLRLVAVENSGAAFGIAAGRRYLLVAVSLAALLTVIVFFLSGRAECGLVRTALALFAAGVAGNLYDRAFNGGRVRDFIDIVYWPGRHWPAFNVADTMLCVGVGLMLLSGLARKKNIP